jgi:hypothetical protein
MHKICRSHIQGKISICCIAWIAVLLVVIVFFSISWVRFNTRVGIFNDKLRLGMSELEAWILMGPPSASYSSWDKSATLRIGGVEQKLNVIEYVYKGTYFLRDDIVLIFNAKTKELVSKKRAQIGFLSNQYFHQQ